MTQPSKYGSPEMQALIVGDFRKPDPIYVQVNPCTRDGDGVTRCGTHEALFFGVYVGCPGEYAWVADFTGADEARMFATNLCDLRGFILEDNT